LGKLVSAALAFAFWLLLGVLGNILSGGCGCCGLAGGGACPQRRHGRAEGLTGS
jgi:hypothetical protein